MPDIKKEECRGSTSKVMNVKKELFSPIKSKRTFEEVSGKIKTLIFDGVLKPGDRLPSEIELARQFMVSRQTIREALRILELSGFIKVQKGGSGGPLIKDTILNTINNLFLDAFRLEKITTAELTFARIEIEKLVLYHVIDNAGASDIQALQQNIQKAKLKIESNAISTDENIEFHNLLAKATKNPVFEIVVGSIEAVVRDLLTRLAPDIEASGDSTGDEGRLKSENAVSDHEDILNAILNKDREKACRLLEEHLREVGKRLQSLMD
jgi:GntR family transcriptional repressor for pyruvate dehydrogenase complex